MNNDASNNEILLNNQQPKENLIPDSTEIIETLDIENSGDDSHNTIVDVSELNAETRNNNENSHVYRATGEIKQPLPDYTNPQAINSAPMFDNPNSIGTIPPVSLQAEKKPKKPLNKGVFVILILIALAAVGFGTFYVLNYTDLLVKKDTITVSIDDKEIDKGEKLSTDINDYGNVTGTDTKNCNLDLSNVDVNKVGIYEYSVKCGKVSKTAKITVVDNNPIKVETQTVYKGKNEQIEALEFIKNIDSNLTYSFVEPDKVDEIMAGDPGTYEIKIKVSSDEKSIEVEGTIVILEYAIKGYMTCSKEEPLNEELNATVNISQTFGIWDDGNNGFSGLTTETKTLKFMDINSYNSYKSNITNVDATFDETAFTITIIKSKDKDTVINEYGADNMEKYQTIRPYFVNTLGYTCVWKNNG